MVYESGHASQFQAPHQPLDRAAHHRRALACQLPPDLVGTVDLHLGLPDAVYLWHEGIVGSPPGAAPVRLAQQCCVPPIARRGDLQDLADWLDPEGGAMLEVGVEPLDLTRLGAIGATQPRLEAAALRKFAQFGAPAMLTLAVSASSMTTAFV